MTLRDARNFVESFYEGDAVKAILDIANAHNVAVSYQGREQIEGYLGRALTSEEWEDVAPELESYDEWVDNGSDDTVSNWKDHVLNEAGIDRGEGQ